MSINEATNKLLSSIDIVDIISRYIPVTKKGRNYLALCPFHDDNNPSLTISPEKQIFKCFVCGAGGNAISFVADYEKISYFEAAKRVAKLVNFNDPLLISDQAKTTDSKLTPLYKALDDLKNFYLFGLATEEGQEAVKYLDNRNIDDAMRKRYDVGYAPINGHATINFLIKKGHSIKTLNEIGIVGGTLDNPFDVNKGRIMFPIHNMDGEVVGFSGRAFRKSDEEVSKYINSKESPVFHKTSILYNYHRAKYSARNEKRVYVLEGFMDVFALNRIGINSVVALMGTAFTKEHVAMLRLLKSEIILCLDGDDAGQLATLKIIRMLDQAKIPYLIVNNNNDLRDPDDILQEEGEEGLRKYLNNTVDKMEFTLNYYKRANPLKTIDDKKVFVKTLIPVISELNEPLDIDAYLTKLSNLTGFTRPFLEKELENYNKSNKRRDENRIYTERSQTILNRKRTLSRLQLAQRAIIQQMILFPEAVEYTKKNKIFLTDNFYRFLSNYLVNNEIDDPKKTYSALVNHINIVTTDEKKRQERLEQLDELIELQEVKKFSPGIIDDAYKTIIDEGKIERIKKENREKLAQTDDAVERAQIYQEHLEQLKKVKEGG